MLATQVQYWSIQETNRHNRATEQQAQQELSEQRRHSREQESIGWYSAQETYRHNAEGERLGWANLTESQRHNMSTEGIQSAQLEENRRHNRESENISGVQATAAYTNAKTNQKNADTSYMSALANKARLEAQTREGTSSEIRGWVDSLLGTKGVLANFSNIFTGRK